jgi:hypothetical protein
VTTLTTRTKQPSEKYTIPLEYYGKLPPPATLTLISSTASAVINGTNTNASSTVLQSTTCLISGTQAWVGVKGGSDGVTYKITITTTLSDGSILEDDFLLAVVDS